MKNYNNISSFDQMIEIEQRKTFKIPFNFLDTIQIYTNYLYLLVQYFYVKSSAVRLNNGSRLRSN